MAISLHKVLRVGHSKHSLNKTKHGLRSGIGMKYNVTLYPNLVETDTQDIRNNIGVTNDGEYLTSNPLFFWPIIGFGFLGVFLALLVLLIGQCKRNEEEDYEDCEAETNTNNTEERMRLLEYK